MKEKVINFGLVLDRSGSVKDEQIPLEKGVELLIESLRRKYSQKIEFDITISLVGEEDISPPLLEADNMTIEKIQASTDGIIDNALLMGRRLWEKAGDRRLILFSDGYFKGDDWREKILELKNYELESLERIAVGISEGYYREALLLFASDNEVYEYEDIYDLT